MKDFRYRIESAYPIAGPLISGVSNTVLYLADRAAAIVTAAKSYTLPYGGEIRVIHLESGEVVYRKTASFADSIFEA